MLEISLFSWTRTDHQSSFSSQGGPSLLPSPILWRDASSKCRAVSLWLYLWWGSSKTHSHSPLLRLDRYTVRWLGMYKAHILCRTAQANFHDSWHICHYGQWPLSTEGRGPQRPGFHNLGLQAQRKILHIPLFQLSVQLMALKIGDSHMWQHIVSRFYRNHK